MNRVHHLLCRSGWWRRTVERRLLPWALRGVPLDGPVLEIGPGFGVTTRALARRVAQASSLPRLSEMEMNALVGKLFACQVPNYTPDGRPTLVMLDGLKDADGSAIVVHAKPDDYTTQPIGGAGDRVGCAIIR